MTRSTIARRASVRPVCTLLAALVFGSMVAGCNKPTTSVLLQLFLAENVDEPEQLLVRTYHSGGEAFTAQTLTPEPLTSQRGIGSMLVYPPAPDVKSVRIYVRGSRGGNPVAHGVIRFNFQANMQGERTLTLERDSGGDRDGDEIPDSIDNCPDARNPDQNDDDRDGAGNVCEGSNPGSAANGNACSADNQCGSGACVGGICCDSKCENACSSCHLPDKVGTCSRKPMDAGSETCGDAPRPDAGPPPPAGSNGAKCDNGKECASGFCSDGVCCAEACEGLCQSCNTANNAGVCKPRPAGEADRMNRCSAEPESTCGRDGKCDGAGACRKHAKGTVCQTGGCASPAQEKPSSVCDGAGACQEQTAKLCAPFLCGPAACRTTCDSSDQCATGSNCTDGKCVGNGACGPAPCPTGDLSNGLVLHFSFDDKPGSIEAADRSGNNHTGTLKDGNPQTAWSTGRVGGALTFTGNATGSHVMVPSSSTINQISTGLSIATWVWRDFFQEYKHSLVARRAANTGGSLYELVLENNKLRIRINSANGYKGDVGSTADIPATKWVHVAVTYDVATGGLVLYVDGVVSQRGSYMLQVGPDQSPIIVGGAERVNTVFERFQGKLDELVIYRRALTAAEVQGLAAGAIPPQR
ncbi:MAG TPA: LamG domain-containing protein [Polyangia bacterium]